MPSCHAERSEASPRPSGSVLEEVLGMLISKCLQFKSYPGLYHLFMPVEGGGKATPAAYSLPGHVVVGVINDIAQWVKHVL